MTLSRTLKRMCDQRLNAAYRPIWSPGLFELNLKKKPIATSPSKCGANHMTSSRPLIGQHPPPLLSFFFMKLCSYLVEGLLSTGPTPASLLPYAKADRICWAIVKSTWYITILIGQSYIRKGKYRPATPTASVSRSGDPPGNLKRGRLESFGLIASS